MPRAAAVLHGLGIPQDRLRRLAGALGMACWTGGDGAGAARVVLLFGDGDAAEQPAHWLRPFAAWIETDTRSDDALGRSIARAAGTDLYASITTGTANRLHLAARVVAALSSRRTLSETQRDDIELALHEAISNAVVHGNLQVDGMKGLSVAALDRFSHDLAARIADPTFAGRLIEVTVRLEPQAAVVEVTDEGDGFAPTAPAGAVGAAPSGRGLDLISAIAERVELLDEGRRIRMRFAL
ncbi:MAG TPA: ATP-binding protein [Azospirillum sp.]